MLFLYSGYAQVLLYLSVVLVYARLKNTASIGSSFVIGGGSPSAISLRICVAIPFVFLISRDLVDGPEYCIPRRDRHGGNISTHIG